LAWRGSSYATALILIGQIHTNEKDGQDPFHAVVEATVQRAPRVILTALAAVLAFIPLTFSVFWSSLAYTLIGGTIGGMVLTLVFLPARYALWFKIREGSRTDPSMAPILDASPPSTAAARLDPPEAPSRPPSRRDPLCQR